MEKQKNIQDKWPKYLGYASLVVVMVWGLSFVVVYSSISGWTERGQFGDLFGAINALFSGLAFAGLIITIRQQHLDLQNQQDAIAQTNEEMLRQAEEFNLQNQTQRKQQFDNTFFELLRMLETLIDSQSLNVVYSKYVDRTQKTH